MASDQGSLDACLGRSLIYCLELGTEAWIKKPLLGAKSSVGITEIST